MLGQVSATPWVQRAAGGSLPGVLPARQRFATKATSDYSSGESKNVVSSSSVSPNVWCDNESSSSCL